MSAEHRDRTPGQPSPGEENFSDTLAFLARRLNLPGVPATAEELLSMLPPEDPETAKRDRHLSDQDVEGVLRASATLERASRPELRSTEQVIALSEYVAVASELPSYRGTIVTEGAGQHRDGLHLHSLLNIPGSPNPTDIVTARQHVKNDAPIDTAGAQYALEVNRLFDLGMSLVHRTTDFFTPTFFTPNIITRESGMEEALADPEGYIARENRMNQQQLGTTQPDRFLGFLPPQKP